MSRTVIHFVSTSVFCLAVTSCSSPAPGPGSSANKGDVCAATTECGAGLVCDQQVCRAICNRDNECDMRLEHCSAGVCVIGSLCTMAVGAACTTPPSVCYDSPGVCDGTTGTCTYASLGAGLACQDGDADTYGETCDGRGNCIGGVRCARASCITSPGACYQAQGTCDAQGACAYAPLAMGEPCDDGDALTPVDHCDGAGTCVGDAPCTGDADCIAPGASCDNTPGTCDFGTGICSFTAKPAGSICDDGNAQTIHDACDNTGHCASTPNTAPVVSPIADLQVQLGSQPNTIVFAASEGSATGEDDQVLSATLVSSSDVIVAPLAALRVRCTDAGFGCIGTVEFLQAFGAAGSSLVVLSVTDGIATTQTSFTLTVACTPGTQTFAADGTFDMPVGCNAATVLALGGGGGAGDTNGGVGGNGGPGGFAQATLVAPGTLTVMVGSGGLSGGCAAPSGGTGGYTGGAGSNAAASAGGEGGGSVTGGSAGASTTGSAGGVGRSGGGGGGAGANATTTSGVGGGGGGASVVQSASVVDLVIAGGGGGGGGGSNAGGSRNGGAGGSGCSGGGSSGNSGGGGGGGGACFGDLGLPGSGTTPGQLLGGAGFGGNAPSGGGGQTLCGVGPNGSRGRVVIKYSYQAAGVVAHDTGAIEGVPLRFAITVHATNPALPVTFQWHTVDLSARAGVDYLAGSGSKSVLAGTESTEILVSTFDNAVKESVRSLELVLTGVSNAVGTDLVAVGFIGDDETCIASETLSNADGHLLFGDMTRYVQGDADGYTGAAQRCATAVVDDSDPMYLSAPVPPPLFSLRPRAAVSVAGAGTAWSMPSEAQDPAPGSATASNFTSQSQYLKVTDFVLDVPVDAVIRGVVVHVKRSGTTSGGGGPGVIDDKSVRLVVGDVMVGTDHASDAPWGSPATTVAYGAADDLWGVTLTPIDVNSSQFGVAIAARETGGAAMPNASIDHVWLEVFVDRGLDCDDTNASVWVTRTVYADMDNDGYGADIDSETPPVPACTGYTLPAGYPTKHTIGAMALDCYDKNASAHPGQTAFYTSSRGANVTPTPDTTTAGLSFDYDCSGAEEFQLNCVTTLPTPACKYPTMPTGIMGWVNALPAKCGVASTFRQCPWFTDTSCATLGGNTNSCAGCSASGVSWDIQDASRTPSCH